MDSHIRNISNYNSTRIFNKNETVAALQFQCLNLMVTYPLYGAYLYSFVAMISFDGLLSPITIILNSMIISVVCKNSCLQTIPNCILVNLAVSDLLSGLISQPCKAIQTALFLKRTATCPFYLLGLLLGYVFGMVSCLTLALMALERYLAIFRPFVYIKLTVNRRWLYVSIAVIWLTAVSFVTVSVATRETMVMRSAAIAFVIFTIASSAIVYARAIVVVKRINRRVTALPSEISFGTSNRGDKLSTLARNGRKLKATKMAALILIVMLACYAPSCVLTTLRNIAKLDSDLINGLHDWGQSFVLLNSSLNPIIYCLNLTEIRKKVILLAKKRTCCQK
eukprot:gene11246-12425_t